MIEKAIQNYLLSNATVSGLIGTRYWPMVLDQDYHDDDGPAVTYEFISTDDNHTLTDGRVELVTSRIQFVCYSQLLSSALAVARAIRKSGITTLKGIHSEVDIRGVMVADGILTNVIAPNDGQAGYRYTAEFDLMVSYQE